MRVLWCVFVAFFISVNLWSQENPAPTPQPRASQPPVAQPAPAAAPMPLPTPNEPNVWRAQHTRQLRNELDQMRAKLAEMKINASKVKEPALSKQLELETELWQMMLAHVEELNNSVMRMQFQYSHMPNPATRNMHRPFSPGQPGQMNPAPPMAPAPAPQPAAPAPVAPDHQ